MTTPIQVACLLGCLFEDVSRDPVLLRVFNCNRDRTVIGAFNRNHHKEVAERGTIAGTVSPADAPELRGREFVGFAQRTGKLWRSDRNERESAELAEGDWEIVTFAPVERGGAVLGLADKLNCSDAIVNRSWKRDGSLAVTLRDGGRLLCRSERAPKKLLCEGVLLHHEYDHQTGRNEASLPGRGEVRFELEG